MPGTVNLVIRPLGEPNTVVLLSGHGHQASF